ncbi:DNA topoisomerase IB [Oricola cellulosilytica]|uniref:DNA topoisomerase n=1 Tax=Oricola cellulosilytica TaxID=1429082 RepID=A0A4V2MPQ1_9HYPH|nr:DNA topoisomerase IB [Oricola cellulosilytica]TCD15087.1 DNA topoisomerase IB [Oricola cellulosilytica]
MISRTDRRAYERYAQDHQVVLCESRDLTVRREPAADGFSYVHGRNGKPVSAKTAVRIDSLVIPPAWEDVQIANDPAFHIQAIGTDEAGRRQYCFHPDWEKITSAVKADRLYEFGRSLPRIRRKVQRDIKRTSATKPLAAATATWLLDKANMRPGHEAYAEEGGRGAVTLRKSDVRIQRNGRIELRYKGKSAKRHHVTVKNSTLAKKLDHLRRHSETRRVFVYGQQRQLTASALNSYLRDAAGRAISAKDFRTFAATAYALDKLARCAAKTEKARDRTIANVSREVADMLRNTPAVAKSSYIHHDVLQEYKGGRLDPALVRGRRRQLLSRAETALMRFLEQRRQAGSASSRPLNQVPKKT